MEIDCERDKFEWNDICDNRDFSVIRSHNQKNEQIMKQRQIQTFKDEILWLKVRNLIIRAIAASHNIVSESIGKNEFHITNTNKSGTETNGSEKRNSVDVLSELSLQFRQYIDSLKDLTFAEPMVWNSIDFFPIISIFCLL